MTVKECFENLGADYDDVLRRMGTQERLLRFLSKFPQDPSFSLLCGAYERGDAGEAFRAVHSLKGVSVNLGLSSLYASACALTEELRGGTITPASAPMLEHLRQDYEATIACIRELEA
ncbi:Hpt domain-containing protein [Harryflintia acetispora]|uniref:Hpt domain-containing protein n=1 Tax=Harryflintia acetispora TaxID=1849041 RepID=UPI0018975024|nr:Hpt domain-containing protein [Harryflintia acetispora]